MQDLRDVEVVVLPSSDVEPEKTTTDGTSDLEATLVTPFDDERLFFSDAFLRDEQLGVSLRDEVTVRELHVPMRRQDH